MRTIIPYSNWFFDSLNILAHQRTDLQLKLLPNMRCPTVSFLLTVGLSGPINGLPNPSSTTGTWIPYITFFFLKKSLTSSRKGSSPSKSPLLLHELLLHPASSPSFQPTLQHLRLQNHPSTMYKPNLRGLISPSIRQHNREMHLWVWHWDRSSPDQHPAIPHRENIRNQPTTRQFSARHLSWHSLRGRQCIRFKYLCLWTDVATRRLPSHEMHCRSPRSV
jgi:hypothetical protein